MSEIADAIVAAASELSDGRPIGLRAIS